MKFLFALLLPFTAIATSQAQIYADFVVRQGESPLGTFRARLDYDKAPRICANFIGLATGKRPWMDVTNGSIRNNTPFYNGLKFHRLIHSFVIQAGSPNGLGTDGPGYVVMDEYHPALRHSGRYILSMAKTSQPNTNGSQFFITLRATPELDDKHSVFGEVIDGKAIIDGFTNSTIFPTNASNQPLTPIVIDSVTISGPDAESFNLEDPAFRLPKIGNSKIAASRNVAAATFTLTFDQVPQSDYHVFYSFDLASWTSSSHILNLDNLPGEPSTFTELTAPRFFARVAPVSYAGSPNAPPNLVAAGKTLTLTTRSGSTLLLTFNGSGGGTWSNGAGGSGTLSSVSWSDYVPAAGNFVLNGLFANRIPIGVLSLNFSPAAGSLTSLNAYVSFHTPSTGYLEETGGTITRHAFTWSP